jgi:hypothetical protein
MRTENLWFAGAKSVVWVIMSGMFGRFNKILLFVALVAAAAAGCSKEGEKPANANANTQAAESPKPAATPSNQFTEADVAKLKWLEGTWRGMDGQKPFYERIRFEGSTMIVETLTDETMSKIADNGTARFELKDGEFGNTVGEQRSAASSITDDAVQFVPAPPQPGAPAKGNTFRFERQPDGTWRAVLETPAVTGRPAGEKVYKMEPWKAVAK